MQCTGRFPGVSADRFGVVLTNVACLEITWKGGGWGLGFRDGAGGKIRLNGMLSMGLKEGVSRINKIEWDVGYCILVDVCDIDIVFVK